MIRRCCLDPAGSATLASARPWRKTDASRCRSPTHVHFARNPAVEIGNSVGKYGLGPGLDVRGQGGYVPLPSDGSPYRWDELLNPATVALFPAPAWLGHRTRTRRGPHYSGRLDPAIILDEACRNIRGAGAGERHDVLNREVFRVAALVHRGDIFPSEAEGKLRAAIRDMVSRTRGDPSKTARDFADAWRDGMRRARR